MVESSFGKGIKEGLMAGRHVMVAETTLPHGWMIQCTSCSRRIFLYRSRDLTILDRGDFGARHSWSNQPELRGASVGVSDG